MVKPADDDLEDKPLDPSVERVRRKLVRFVAINLGLLLVALMAVVAALVYKTGRSSPEPSVPSVARQEGRMLAGDIAIPAGSRLLSHSLSGDRVALDVQLADGSRMLFLYDLAERRMIGQFAVKAE
jgi:hypothetical protein